jgi:hypothetical protein
MPKAFRRWTVALFAKRAALLAAIAEVEGPRPAASDDARSRAEQADSARSEPQQENQAS